MNGPRGEEAIANYASSPCIACDCFVAQLTPSASRLAMTFVNSTSVNPNEPITNNQ